MAGEEAAAQPRLGIRRQPAEQGQPRPGLRVGAAAGILDQQRRPRLGGEVAGVIGSV